MSRIQAREFAFKIIFSLQFNFPSESAINNEDEGKNFFKLVNGNLQLNELAINDFLNENALSQEDDKTFFYDIINSFISNKEQIENIINRNVSANKFKAIYKSDMAVLQLAVAEMLMKKYDYQIVVNEAVELAKKYSDEKNYKFVHSVLSKIIKEIYSE